MRVKKNYFGRHEIKNFGRWLYFILYMKSVLFSICRSKKKICIALTSYDYFGPALDSEPLHVPPGTWNLYTVILVEDFLVNITMK